MRAFRVAALVAIASAAACSTSTEVPVAGLWGLGMHVGGPGKSAVTTGTLEKISLDRDSCDADLVDGTARVHVNGSGSVCEQLRAAGGRRVVVEGIVSLGCAEPDVKLSPDGGGPIMAMKAVRVEAAP